MSIFFTIAKGLITRSSEPAEKNGGTIRRGALSIGRDILILPTDPADDGWCATSLAAAGWYVVPVPDAVAAVAALRLSPFAFVCHMADLPDDDAAWIATEAACLPVPTPVLTIDAALRLTVDDRRPHAIAPTVAPRPDPLARLTPLFGAAGVAQLLARFRDRLAAVLDAPDPFAVGEGLTVAALAHRIVGMAGMLDFPELATAWAAVETGGDRYWARAWTETRIARAMLDRILDRTASR